MHRTHHHHYGSGSPGGDGSGAACDTASASDGADRRACTERTFHGSVWSEPELRPLTRVEGAQSSRTDQARTDQERGMSASHIGAVVGLTLGAIWALAGFTGALIAGALAIVGYLAGRVVTGQLDLTDYLGHRRDGDA